VVENRAILMLCRSQITACIAASELIVSFYPVSAADTSSNEKHRLWRITNARAPFYLLGSVHSLQRSD